MQQLSPLYYPFGHLNAISNIAFRLIFVYYLTMGKMLYSYTISDALLRNIKDIGVLVSELNRKIYPDVVLFELERSARAISAYSSTSIEGNPLPLTDVKQILKSTPANLRDSEKEVVNYNEALLYLGDALKENKHTFNLKEILKIHKIVTKGLINSLICGKLRMEPVFVNDPRKRQTVYWPPDHKDVPALMEGLLSFVANNRGTIDPLILAGLFHKQFVVIHPFLDGNGRVVRLATKLLLADMGLNTFNLFSFENYYNKNVSRYFEKVGVYGNYYDIKDKIDFTEWLTYFTEGIIDELSRVKKELETAGLTPENILPSYLTNMLKHIESHGFITDREYAKITKRAKPTRNIDFKRLIRLGLIVKLGLGKSTYYKLK
jgi:Fic family protein